MSFEPCSSFRSRPGTRAFYRAKLRPQLCEAAGEQVGYLGLQATENPKLPVQERDDCMVPSGLTCLARTKTTIVAARKKMATNGAMNHPGPPPNV